MENILDVIHAEFLGTGAFGVVMNGDLHDMKEEEMILFQFLFTL
jgi:hypothetical protein